MMAPCWSVAREARPSGPVRGARLSCRSAGGAAAQCREDQEARRPRAQEPRRKADVCMQRLKRRRQLTSQERIGLFSEETVAMDTPTAMCIHISSFRSQKRTARRPFLSWKNSV